MSKSKDYFNVPTTLITRAYNDRSVLPEYRSEFMRDRDRIMYATAFRRLAGKTQIYTVGLDDHKRNRLTHTLEVSQIARTISIALGLNANLSEAIALAHDFGHTPFGHAGEQMLHDIMVPNSFVIKSSPFYKQSMNMIEQRFEREKNDKISELNSLFGFKHNLQSVRVCTSLEDSYRGRNNTNIGLNLTNFTLYGMMIHSDLRYKDSKSYCPNYQNKFDAQMKLKGSEVVAWSFEAYIVRLADDIAQWHHDLEDAIRGYALPLDKICNTIEESIGKILNKKEIDKLKRIRETGGMDRRFMAELSHIVVNTLVNDVVKTSTKNMNKLKKELKKLGVGDSEEFFKKYDELKLSIKRENVIAVSKEVDTDKFKKTISASIHHSRNVERMNEKGKYIIRKLFEAYFAHPQQLPDGPILHLLVETGVYRNVDAAKKDGIGVARTKFDKLMKNPDIFVQSVLMRRTCDHIASMTDHYAIEEYNNLYG